MKANKLFKMEVDSETAKILLLELEKQLAAKIQDRLKLDSEIVAKQNACNELRKQFHDDASTNGRSATGSNKSKIKEFLSLIPENKGAKLSEIAKATGIGTSSVSFTVSGATDMFTRDEATKIWRLK